jgi:hypothetical protein
MGIFRNEGSQLMKDLDAPVPTTGMSLPFFKRGKLRCVFIYEDGSYSEVYKKFNKPYFIEYKDKRYQVVPKAILKSGKNPMIMWYYNNPAPIMCKFEHSQLTIEELQRGRKRADPKENLMYAQTFIDAEALHAAFSSNVFKNLYGSKLNMKMLLIIIGVVIIVIIILLQATGKIDIFGALSGNKGG